MSLYSLSSPVLTSESIPSSTSTRVSQDFNEWYQGLGIHSVYEEDLDSPEKERCLKEWVKDKPISVRGLDRVDRVVLKIAGQYFSTNVSLVFSSCNVICNEISRQYLMWVPSKSQFLRHAHFLVMQLNIWWTLRLNRDKQVSRCNVCHTCQWWGTFPDFSVCLWLHVCLLDSISRISVCNLWLICILVYLNTDCLVNESAQKMRKTQNNLNRLHAEATSVREVIIIEVSQMTCQYFERAFPVFQNFA